MARNAPPRSSALKGMKWGGMARTASAPASASHWTVSRIPPNRTEVAPTTLSVSGPASSTKIRTARRYSSGETLKSSPLVPKRYMASRPSPR